MFRRSIPIGIAAGTLTIALGAAAAAIYARGVSPQPNPKANDPATLQAARPAAEADATFGLKLFQQLTRAQPGTNVVCSPESVAAALGMAYEGARGQTRTEMGKALALSALGSDSQRRAARSALQTALDSPDPDVALRSANALWVDPGTRLQSEFTEIARADYRAEANTAPLSANPAAAAGQINDWVKQKTQGMIPDIVQADSLSDAALVLTNAVYFKGLWNKSFDKSDTNTQPFHRSASSAHPVQMMHQKERMGYLRGSGFQMVRLAFGGKTERPARPPRFSFYVILPDRVDGLPAVISHLNAETLRGWISASETAEVKLSLPRIKVAYESMPDLRGPLKSLGIVSAFDPAHADLSGLCDPSSFISQVKHKAVVEADEEGAAAAAATSAVIMPTAMPMPRPITTVTVDHPFLFLICDDATHAVLFAGAVYDPQP